MPESDAPTGNCRILKIITGFWLSLEEKLHACQSILRELKGHKSVHLFFLNRVSSGLRKNKFLPLPPLSSFSSVPSTPNAMNRVGLVCQKSQQMKLTNWALPNALNTIGQKAWPCLAHSSPYLFGSGSSSVARKACLFITKNSFCSCHVSSGRFSSLGSNGTLCLEQNPTEEIRREPLELQISVCFVHWCP